MMRPPARLTTLLAALGTSAFGIAIVGVNFVGPTMVARAAYDPTRASTDPAAQQRLDEFRTCARAGSLDCELKRGRGLLELARNGSNGVVADGVRHVLDAMRKDHGAGTSQDPAHYSQAVDLQLVLARTARAASDPGDQRMLVLGMREMAREMAEMPEQASSPKLAAATVRAFAGDVVAIMEADPGNAKFAGSMVLARYDLRSADRVFREEGGYTRTLALTDAAQAAAREPEAQRLAHIARAEARAKGIGLNAEADVNEAATKVREDVVAALSTTPPEQVEAVSLWAVLATRHELKHRYASGDLKGHLALVGRVNDTSPGSPHAFEWPERHGVVLNHAAVAYAYLTTADGVATLGPDNAATAAKAYSRLATVANKAALARCGLGQMASPLHALCTQSLQDAELFATAKHDEAAVTRLRGLREHLPTPVDPPLVDAPPLAPPPQRDGEDRLANLVKLAALSTTWDVPGDRHERHHADRAPVLAVAHGWTEALDERTLGAAATGDGHPAERADAIGLLALAHATSGDLAGARLMRDQAVALDPAVLERKPDGGRVPFGIQLDRLLDQQEALARKIVLLRPDMVEQLTIDTVGWEPLLANQATRALEHGADLWLVPDRQGGGTWVTFAGPADLPLTLVVDGQQVPLPDGPDAVVVELVDIHGDWSAKPIPLPVIP